MEDRSKSRMLWVLGFMLFLANGDNYAAASLLGEIAVDLDLSLGRAALSVMAYMLSFGLFTLVFGPLSDRFGKVKVFIAASMGTAVFSILGAFAFNLHSLVVFRAMNGMFGAGIFPVAFALIGDAFDDGDRQHAISKTMGMAFLGAATATAVGGTFAYLGSWRFVYLVYGIAELILAVWMTRLLKKDQPSENRISSWAAYQRVWRNPRFMRLTFLIFGVGFSVFGTFTYAGVLIQKATSFNVLTVGVLLSVFGVGTVAGGRLAPVFRRKTKSAFLVYTGLLGCSSMLLLSVELPISFRAVGLLGFGMAFVLLQSTLVATILAKHPEIKGTVMSMSGFHLFLGGACGTAINARLMKAQGVEMLFTYAAFVFLITSLVAAVFVSRFEKRERAALDVLVS
ncbi:MFS transporter [Kiritimatiellaeota bacterium B1221]|nr:MFS transporter [Kiritimatiellaeota bacterium B1221]